MTAAQETSSVEAFQKFAQANPQTVAFFWVPSSEPCAALSDAIEDVSASRQELSFVRVNAEKMPELAAHLSVTAVPTFVFLNKGDAVDRVEGFDPVGLYAAADKLAELAPKADGLDPDGDVTEQLHALVRKDPVVLFMKGSPDAPRCGFSRRVVDALRDANIPFGHFDILLNDVVRQELKTFSNWPTYPQLFAGGELVGGCDIILELAKDGSLRTEVSDGLEKAGISLPTSEDPLTARIQLLLASKPVMLFMKGVPAAPRCGFSSKVVEALQSAGVEFGHFDILQDEDIRQGLKKHSDWPTYPQLYANGELLGGCDIILEMAASGSLKAEIDQELASKTS